jgi:DNA repair photolyase
MTLIYEPKGRAGEYSTLALNIYRGCGHRCSYCYAPAALKMTKVEFDNPKPRENIIANLQKELKGDNGLFRDSGKDPVLLCFSCDPYQPLDEITGLTRRVISLLHDAGYPVHILTKGGKRACRDFDLLKHNGDAFASTLTFINPELSLQYEPGAALPEDRIAAIKNAHNNGIRTWVSLEPVIDVEQTLDLIEITHSFVDHFKIGKLNYIKSSINWRAFGFKVLAIMEAMNKSYYIKDDLSYEMGI